MKDEQPSLGVSAIVRLRRRVADHPEGETGMITRQSRAGRDRYEVMLPGDPMPLHLRPSDLELVQGIERAETGWWWKRGGPECSTCPHRTFGGALERPAQPPEAFLG